MRSLEEGCRQKRRSITECCTLTFRDQGDEQETTTKPKQHSYKRKEDNQAKKKKKSHLEVKLGKCFKDRVMYIMPYSATN